MRPAVGTSQGPNINAGTRPIKYYEPRPRYYQKMMRGRSCPVGAQLNVELTRETRVSTILRDTEYKVEPEYYFNYFINTFLMPPYIFTQD